MRGGWKNTYHFKVIWERLYQVIASSQQAQNVSTKKVEPVQNVPTESEQNVSSAPVQCQQNVPKERPQNVATLYRDNNRENKETEKTDRENQTTWNKTVENLQADLPQEEVAARFAGTALIEVTETKAMIFVPNRFAIPWLERRLYGQIAKAIKGVVGKDLDLQFVTCS
jgi:DnaA N-terminal domain